MKLLRAEKERLEAKQKDESVKAERAKKQNQAHIRLLNEQLEEKRGQVIQAKEELEAHVCSAYVEQSLVVFFYVLIQVFTGMNTN